MKASLKQFVVINKFIEALEWLRDSNDITSPTHFNDFEDSFSELLIDGEITESELEEYSTMYRQLNCLIKKL